MEANWRSSTSDRILSEEGRARETVYIQKMERERMEKMKQKMEQEKTDKEKSEKGDQRTEMSRLHSTDS